MKKYLLVFIFSFMFSFVFFYMIGSVYCDEVWLYGFSHNMSRGMVIYRDYNVVTTPLYFFVVSIFIRVFGEFMMVGHMVDSLMYASMIVMLYKLIGKKVFIMLPLFMFFGVAGYNLMCLFFLVIIIYLLNKGYDNDILIAFLVGLCFITKQNIGVFLFIPMFIYSKNKLKSVCSFMLPLLIVVIYLVYNDSLYQFIDYCFLGLFNFGKDNLYVDKLFIILFLINIIYIGCKLFKSRFRDKELLYILSFQMIMYPIFDFRHYLCSLFLVVYVVLKSISNKRIELILGCFVYFLYMGLFVSSDYDINFKSKTIDYLKNNGELEMLASSVIEYVGDNNFFFTDFYGYYIKLYYDIEISQYDLLLSGNVGYNGMEERLEELDELCSNEVCYFFLDDSKNNEIVYDQYSEFVSYIKKNYRVVDSLFEFNIYSNKS